MLNLLSRYGPIEDWQATEKCNYRESRAIVRFRNFKDAQAAARGLDGYRLPEIGHSRLRMRRNVSLRFRRIPGSVFDVLEEEIDKLREDLRQAGQVRMEVGYEIDYCQREFVGVQLSGRHALYVAKAKSAVQDLLAGELAMWGDSKLWNNWFAKSKGSTFFASLSAIYEGFVRVDIQTEQIFLYGSAHVKEGMQNAIVDKLVMPERQSIILRDPEDPQSVMQGGYRRMVEATAQHRARLQLGSSTKKITISGTKENFDPATHPLYEPTTRIHEDNTSKPDCSVCLTPASDPFQTTCGHIYCKSCFANQCSAATSKGMIPIRCLGDSDNCYHIFKLEELRIYLTHASFEQLLKTSLAQYVRSNSRSLRHCPTPDCPSIYRLTTEWDKLLCHSCLNVICINCQVQDHYGMSCEAYQAAIKAEEKFTKWKEEHNVNECPKCDAPIEKLDGCNHIECTNCANHICWQCMASFSTGPEVYQHMQEEHGTFMPLGEGWEEEEEEEAAFGHDFNLDIPDLPRPNRQMPDFQYLINHQGHGPLILAALPTPPPPALTPPLPFNHARMDDAFFENILPLTPPGNDTPLDPALLQAPLTPPRDRRRGDGVIIWLMNMLRNNAPRTRHFHHPQPETPEPPALLTNNAHGTEAEERHPESGYEDDLETASELSRATTSDVLAPLLDYSPSESDEDVCSETPPLNEEDDTSTEAEEEVERASTADSEIDGNRYWERDRYGDVDVDVDVDVDPADDVDVPLVDYGLVYEMARGEGLGRGLEILGAL